MLMSSIIDGHQFDANVQADILWCILSHIMDVKFGILI